MPNFPFYYKVRFHLITRDKENNLEFHNQEKEFSDPDPLKARQEAFEEFEEYLKFLKETNKVVQDERGNFKIISPSGLPVEPEFREGDSEEDFLRFMKRFTEYLEFREEIEVLLIINDDNLLDEIGSGDRVFPIHTVASHPLDSQNRLGNLELVELELYRRSGIDMERHTINVQHYGVDYEESGEDEEAAQWTVLPTPYVWQTKEQYLEVIGEDEESLGEPDHLSWEKIIAGGETNTLELKSSLAYSFNENVANWKPLYNNARTICGFLNANGGLLIIGVADDGSPQGLEKDYHLLGNKDKLRLKIDDLISSYFNNTVASLIDVSFETVAQKEILVIVVKSSKTPIFLRKYNSRTAINSKHFFIRRNASTTEIKDVEDIVTYILNHWYHSKNG